MHFQQILRETKSKSAKFRIRWSKVPRVLGPQNRAMAILVTRPATAGASFHPLQTWMMSGKEEPNGVRVLATMRAITPGEESVFNYGTSCRWQQVLRNANTLLTHM